MNINIDVGTRHLKGWGWARFLPRLNFITEVKFTLFEPLPRYTNGLVVLPRNVAKTPSTVCRIVLQFTRRPFINRISCIFLPSYDWLVKKALISRCKPLSLASKCSMSFAISLPKTLLIASFFSILPTVFVFRCEYEGEKHYKKKTTPYLQNGRWIVHSKPRQGSLVIMNCIRTDYKGSVRKTFALSTS